MTQVKVIYPAQFAENTVESFLAEHSNKRHALYWWILGLLVVAFISLPFLRVDVTVRATGVIRTAAERVEIAFRSAGFVVELPVKDNTVVTNTQVVATVQSRTLEEQLRYNEQKLAELRLDIDDLRVLVKLDLMATNRPAAVKRSVWLADWERFVAQMQSLRLSLGQSERELVRAEKLVQEKLIPGADWEGKQYLVQKAKADIESLDRQTLSHWLDELTTREKTLIDVLADARQLNETKDLGVIRAPCAGTALFVPGLAVGSFVTAGTKIGEISPSDQLVAEMYVPPRDVVHLRRDQGVRLQVDGFPYTEWGMLPGTIADVASDYVLVGQQPLFKVRINLTATKLQLANGIGSEIQKGMTCQARFQVTSRSLLQLLFESASQWLNPTVSTGPTNPQKPEIARQGLT